jgi:AcrR family transcriptional regulator
LKETITERQLELIEAAGKILTHSGVKGLTTKNLAKEMGFSEAAIYRHFGSKEKIIVAMLLYIAASMDERYRVTLATTDNPEIQFKKLFQNQFNYFGANPHFVVAVFADGLLEESELINQSILKIMEVKMKYLMPIIEAGQAENVFTSNIPKEDLVHIIMGSIRLQMYKWRISNFRFDIVKKGDEIIQSILTTIKA